MHIPSKDLQPKDEPLIKVVIPAYDEEGHIDLAL